MGAISPTYWRKAQMRQPTKFGTIFAIQFHKPSCAKLYQYIQLETTPKFLCSTLAQWCVPVRSVYAYACTSTGAKAACRMLMKSTHGLTRATHRHNVRRELKATPKSRLVSLLAPGYGFVTVSGNVDNDVMQERTSKCFLYITLVGALWCFYLLDFVFYTLTQSYNESLAFKRLDKFIDSVNFNFDDGTIFSIWP